MNDNTTKIDLLVLFVISYLVLLWGLGSGSLTSWDEALYGTISREILRTGDWLSLRWAGLPWNDKPPLYMWMTVVSYKLFGVNEFSVRFFSALCGIGTVLATYLLGRALYSRRAGFAASLALLTSYHFFWASRVGMLDVALTFFTTLSFLFFKLGEKDKVWLFFSPVAFALAFLTKSMAALSVPVALGLYLIFSGEMKALKEKPFLAGVTAALLLLVSWHWAVFAHYGGNFARDYLVRNLFTRATTAMEGHTGDIFTYFGVIPNKGRPWALLGFALLPYAAWRILARGEKEHIMPVVWASTVFVITSAVKTKLHWYVMPIYPALALMSGWALSKVLKKYTAPAVCVLAAASLIYLASHKHVFNLDYSPEIKRTAQAVLSTLSPGEKVYLYDISDPGMQFYLFDAAENVRGEDKLNAALAQKGAYLLTVRGKQSAVSSPGSSMILETSDFILLRTK